MFKIIVYGMNKNDICIIYFNWRVKLCVQVYLSIVTGFHRLWSWVWAPFRINEPRIHIKYMTVWMLKSHRIPFFVAKRLIQGSDITCNLNEKDAKFHQMHMLQIFIPAYLNTYMINSEGGKAELLQSQQSLFQLKLRRQWVFPKLWMLRDRHSVIGDSVYTRNQ